MDEVSRKPHEVIVSTLNDLDELLYSIKQNLSSEHFLIIQMSMQFTLFVSKVALMLGKRDEEYVFLILLPQIQLLFNLIHIKLTHIRNLFYICLYEQIALVA